ncbi:MAG: hypothetical protein ABIP48_19500 [Planctomycetota bacterium]
MIRRNLSWAPLAVLLVVIAGCDGSNRAAVTGEVTLDGEPVDGGTISFTPSGGAADAAAWGEIKGGRYSIPAAKGPGVGTARVEIRWDRKTGKKIAAVPPAPPDTMIEETEEAVPARYNTQSELTADVQAGQNTFNFELKSE